MKFKDFEQNKHDPVKHTDNVRAGIALCLLSVFMFISVWGAVVGFDPVKDLLSLVIGPIFGFLGFYSANKS